MPYGLLPDDKRRQAFLPAQRPAAVALLLMALLGAALPGCVTHTGQIDSAAEAVRSSNWAVREDVSYVPADWPKDLVGDLYLPEAPRPLPVVLLVHGGGWERGKPEHMAGIAERLADRGYAVFNINYRLAPEFRFPAPVHDLQMALRWLRENAAANGLDSEAIAAFGYSAGAHLVSLVGFLGEGDELDRPYGGPQTRLQAVVAGATPSDLSKFKGGRLVPQFLDTTLKASPQRYRQASPISYIDKDDSPIFIYHGGMDWLVSRDHADDMKLALDAAGVPAELYIERFLGHVSLFLFDNSAVTAAIDFLDTVLRPADSS